jgi:HemY protein
MPLTQGRVTQRVCTLMARIEGEEHGDKGRVREWLARAVNAPRDPVWTADGIVSDTWQPVSPVTGALDAFQYKVPVESHEVRDAELLAQKLEELVTLGAPREVVVSDEAKVIEVKPLEVKAAEVKTAEPKAPVAADAPIKSPEVAAPVVHTLEVDPSAKPKALEKPAETVLPVAASVRPKPDESEVVAVTPVSVSAKPATAESKPATSGKTSDVAAAPVAAAAAATAPVTGAPARIQPVPPASPSSKGPAGNPKIFVPPRAPDDPGLDNEEERRSPLAKPRDTRAV